MVQYIRFKSKDKSFDSKNGSKENPVQENESCNKYLKKNEYQNNFKSLLKIYI